MIKLNKRKFNFDEDFTTLLLVEALHLYNFSSFSISSVHIIIDLYDSQYCYMNLQIMDIKTHKKNLIIIVYLYVISHFLPCMCICAL